MQRLAFTMKLLPGNAVEYKRRHNEIWPDLQRLLKESGVTDYSIFLDEDTNVLFGVLKASNPAALERLPRHEVMQRWWKYMADIMETNPDHSPVQVSLQEVFYLS